MSEEKKTYEGSYRKQYMQCHHRYLCSYTAPTLDITCDEKREQLLFHDLSTWSARNNYSVDSGFPEPFQRTSFRQNGLQKAENQRLKANEGGIQREKKGTRGTNLDISRLQANLAVLSTRGEHKQKTKTNELWVVGKRWTWDCWLSRSIKHGQNPSRSCRSSVSTPMLQRSNSLLPSLDLDSHRDRGAFAAQIGAPTIWYRDLDPWTQKFTSEWISPSMLRCEKTLLYDVGWPNCRELKLWYAFCAFDGPTTGCLIKQAMEHLLLIGASLLCQHCLNATCSNGLLKPLKPHAHILMYKSGAASVCAISQAIWRFSAFSRSNKNW